MKRHDLRIIKILILLCLSLTAIGIRSAWSTTWCNGAECTASWEFPPDIPSADNGDVNYTFEFRGWTTGGVNCFSGGNGASFGAFKKWTWEDGTEGNEQVRGRGVAEDFWRDRTCYIERGLSQCKQAKQWTNGVSYNPSVNGDGCNYADGYFYDFITDSPWSDWGPFFELINPITDVSRGYNSAGEMIWEMFYSYPANPLPGFFLESEFCSPCTLHSFGWSSYYKIAVWVKHGNPGPVVPGLPPVFGGGSGLGGGNNGSGPGCLVPPMVRVTWPLEGSVFVQNSTIELKAEAYDGDGAIVGVSFYDGTTYLGTDSDAPYSWSWITTSASSGAHTITAKAIDDCSNETTSPPVSVTLQSGVAPTVSMTAPSSGTLPPGTTTITLSATAADSDGTIAKVEFFRGTTLIGTDYSSPYSIPWNDVSPGSYSLTAKATDDDGIATVSSPVAIVVPKTTVTLDYGYDTDESYETVIFLSKDSTEGLRIWLQVGYQAVFPDDFGVSGFVSGGSGVGYIDIPSGDYDYTIYISPVDDSEIEGTEVLGVTLLPDPAYDIDNDTVYIYIYDND